MSTVMVDIAPEEILTVSTDNISLTVSLQFKTGRKARLKIVADRSIEVKLDKPTQQ